MVKANPKNLTQLECLDQMIHEIRGQRVMLDSDLAQLYGVSTKRLKEQVRRNADRFPTRFSFVLTPQEFAALRSQSATSKGRGGSRYLPMVFTEHGALMLACVLNSPVAISTSIRVVQAFVLMREQLATHKQLAAKLEELEERVTGHDEAIQDVFQAIRQLLDGPEKPHREIGFHVREKAPPYRIGGRRWR